MPKISIIIPVRNTEDYLAECLDSVLAQTLSDIEVICVDDNSDDSSPEILRRYAERDPRVKPILYTENKSASLARKDGVFASTGEYVMFVDSDDTLEPQACERLYAAMIADPVDILHFGTRISNEAGASPERMEWMRGFVRPHEGTLAGDVILEGAFATERLYNFSLWDKLYSAELCKLSFAHVSDANLPKGQDKYAYFILSYFAKTYRGMPGEVLYNYHFGRGITGHNLLSLTEFERFCTMALVANAIRDFLVSQDGLERYGDVYANVRNQLLQDCVANWTRHLAAEDRAKGFDLLLDSWESTEVVAKVAQLNWKDQGHVARLIRDARWLTKPPGEVRVIGTFYHRYANGGVQRVLSMLIKLWLDLGFRVVLFTDVPPSDDDYELPAGVERVVLPSTFDVDSKNYGQRAEAILKSTKEHGIDVMVYHAWVSKILVWDLLVCKTAGVSFIAHCHSVFSQPARGARPYFADMPYIYALCDGVVALSEADRAYWGNFNSNVVRVANPVGIDLQSLEPSTLTDKTVLWLGRISDEKRPLEALRIFGMVLAAEPDARLLLVGSAADPEDMAEVQELLSELRIRDSVVMCGFHKDVMPFYEQASVLLMTSEYEGFPQVLSESQAAGVPTVMYELPYLTITRERRGVLAVEMGDMEAAADAVVKLLGDTELRRSLGREARANAEAMAQFDLAGTWRAIFGGLTGLVRTPLDETSRIMWETLHAHYRTGAVEGAAERAELRRALLVARRSGVIRSARRVWRRSMRRLRELRVSRAQRIDILARVASGEASVREVCRTHGISERALYRWQRKYGDVSATEAARLRELERENARLKHLLEARGLGDENADDLR